MLLLSCLSELLLCAMKRAYPAIKFVPPRSTSGRKPAVSSDGSRDIADGYTPPLRETATVSPALATAKKRKRPATQSWKGPRRRLDPPSPSKAQKAAARPASPQARIDSYYRRKVDEKSYHASTSSGEEACKRAAHRNAGAAVRADKRPPKATSAARGCCSTKALVMAAETPARPRGVPLVSRFSIAGADVPHQSTKGVLRIPDTPDPAPKAEGRRATRSEVGRKDAGSDSDSDSCSSSLSSPLLCSKVDEEWEAAGAGGVAALVASSAAASGAAAAAPAATAAVSRAGRLSSIGGSDGAGSESESPDLLRSYTMETRGRSQEPATGITPQCQGGGGGGTGGGGAGAAGGVARDLAASGESDAGSDSPDLLRTYARRNTVLEGTTRDSGTADKAVGQ